MTILKHALHGLEFPESCKLSCHIHLTFSVSSAQVKVCREVNFCFRTGHTTVCSSGFGWRSHQRARWHSPEVSISILLSKGCSVGNKMWQPGRKSPSFENSDKVGIKWHTSPGNESDTHIFPVNPSEKCYPWGEVPHSHLLSGLSS